MKCNSGKGNWFLMFILLVVSMAVFVSATVVWDGGMTQNLNLKNSSENAIDLFSYNFSSNVTFDPVDEPLIYSFGTDSNISTSIQGSHPFSYFSDWININSSSGMLEINASEDNRTGSFNITVDVYNSESTQSAGARTFNFIINATNDGPVFTPNGIQSNYTFSANSQLQSFNLTALDEELNYPLIYSIDFNQTNCTHGADSGQGANNQSCDLIENYTMTLDYFNGTISTINFVPNSSHVGSYWANVSITDAANDYSCPHAWCDEEYNSSNKTFYYSEMVLFTISPALQVDVSNCTDQSVVQDEQFNCTIVITTPGELDDLSIASNASFKEGAYTPGNRSWFYADSTTSATNFNHNVSISITPSKAEVGNYSINFTVEDTTAGLSNFTTIDFFVNFTEDNVSLGTINDLNGSSALYENYTFQVNATDEDLLVRDKSVKPEALTFSSNTSWVNVLSLGAVSGLNYITANISVDHTYVLNNFGEGNYTVLINVTDAVPELYTDNQTFVIEIKNETAPEWDGTLDDPVVVELVEGTLFTYNVSKNVTDVDAEDTVTFYYQNVSGEFCSLNGTNFNGTTGMISFTPVDCDVGYHNVTIIASDSYLNSSKQFNFTVQNLVDSPTIYSLEANNGTLPVPSITEGFNLSIAESFESTFTLIVDDDDFLIPDEHKDAFYNESLTVDVIATNSTGDDVDLFEFDFVEIMGADDSWALYNVSFTPNGYQLDNYTVVVNITDYSGASIQRNFFLNITETLSPPNLTEISNYSITVHDFFNITVNATDDEDDRNGVDLNYSISPLGSGYPDLTIDNVTGVITLDFDSNQSLAGKWGYNVTVNDSDNRVDYQVFYVFAYGDPSLVSPYQGYSFDLVENMTALLNFSVNHSVGDNLTYEFWMDGITCGFNNLSNCTYGNFTLRNTGNSYGNTSYYNLSFSANYTDETYGFLKNITLRAYPSTSELNSTQKNSVAVNMTFKANISHTNSPPEIYNSFGSFSSTYGSATPVNIDLTSYVRDYDYLDSYYQENVSFTISTNASTTGITAESTIVGDALPWNGTIEEWYLQLYATSAVSEMITILANDSSSTIASNPFRVSFTAPSTVTETVPTSGGGGGSTKLKHYSLKLIVPQDVVISDQNYIDIPFSVQNNGQIDLRGINLSSFIRYNDEFSEDVRISLGDNYIEQLQYGQSENFTMRIHANTQKSGRYKATIFANVTSPKLSDWGEFFIDLRTTNETEAEQILIFTEKLVAENPECLELTEIIKEAEEAFALGEYSNSLALARQATEACEDAIEANDQIKYPVAGFVRDNFNYLSYSTLAVFIAGFIFYMYKRVRFNKYKVDNYI